MNSLEKIIHQEIGRDGAMSVARFMELALSHPQYGYYVCKDPLGQAGDFVTAPEVSQMFGEVLGAWAAHSWMQMGRPSQFILLECGPGRGTLMADMMRACAGVDGFCDAAQVHLLEVSPALKAKQAEALSAYSPQWHESLESLRKDVPIIIIANEFFDALPFEQYIYIEDRWFERVIVSKEGAFEFSVKPSDRSFSVSEKAKDGDVLEVSDVRVSMMKMLCEHIKRHKGAGLIIDYGHAKTAFGDTFQAIKGHESVPVFSRVGACDLTSHVDFEPLYGVASDVEVLTQPLMEQGDFLKMLGIEARAQYLKQKGADGIEKDLHRLTARGEMGALFKVMDFRYGF